MRYQDTLRYLLAATKAEDTLLTEEDCFHRRANFFCQLCPKELEEIRYYHVAGTNGKGSVCELLRSSLHAHGRCVGTFTSPHVHTIRERIRVGESLIPRDAVIRHTMSLQGVFHENPWLVFFDKLLAIALRFFAEVGIDTLVLEVGIGGKYDSTNFFRRPAIVSVITSISYDHQELLGDTLEAIAEQKAGIIKKGSVVVCCKSLPATVVAIIERIANIEEARLIVVDPLQTHAGFHLPWLLPDNIGLAKAALIHSGLELSGIERAFWPCRFEEFDIGDGHEIIVLDGAHNADAMKGLLKRAVERYPTKPMRVVFGAGSDKSLGAMLDAVVHTNAALILVRVSHPRAASARTLLGIVSEKKKSCIDLSVYKEGHDLSVEEGIQLAVRHATKPGVAIVCGSLYVAARARQWLAHEHPHLFAAQDWVHEADNKWDDKY